MAESSLHPEPPHSSSDDDVLELNKDLERMIENVENISVQLTWMAYDMVALRTSPELGAAMRGLEEAYHRCRAAVCGDLALDQEPGMMENTEKSTEQASSTARIDLENILKSLDSLSSCMDQLALQTQLRQCDLIVCVGHPDNLACLKVQETLKRRPPLPLGRPETEA